MIDTQVIASHNVAVLAIEQKSPYALRPHSDAEVIPMSKEDEQALRNGIAKDGIKTPLHITPDLLILDGVHRWRIAKELNISLIPVIVYQYTEPEEESLHAINANFQRRQINEGQKAMLKLRMESFQQKLEQKKVEAHERHSQAVREAQLKRWGISTNTTDNVLPQGSTLEKDRGEAVGQVAKATGVSARTLYRAKAVAKANPKRAEAVLKGNVSLTRAYQEVKAEEKAQEVKQLLQEERPQTDLELMTKLGISIQPYDVWSFPQCDVRFGHEYPGRVPGQIIAHCLYFWTEQGDTVLDPMVGSGTTIDVCKVLNRQVLAYDAHPCRDDITLHNLAAQGWPQGTAEAKLIFWDPPYFKKVDSGYGEQSISRYDRAEYLAFFEQMASTIPTAFQGRLAFLMSDYNDDESNKESIWFTDYVNIFTKHDWQIERYIQTPLTTQMIHPDIVKKFRVSKRLARLGRVLVVMSR